MRILYMGLGDTLIGRHLPQSWPDRLFGDRVGEHEILTFGYAEDLDIQIPFEAPFAEVVRRLPAGWVPDVCICTHVDFLMIPPGIEEAPFPTVAVTADWDFRIGIARTMAEAFDLTVALGDESCQAMQTLGARHTLPFAYFGVPEEHFTGELTPIDRHRPIDILFTGTIQDDTHLDRSRWLYRLSQLSKKYRVYIGPASSAQGSYRELSRMSKLVFTFHRRGEIQLRFTDGATEGAAVLDNGVQTLRHFDAETEFLYYDENNFEQVIEQHLADADLRRRKVEAARQRTVQEFGSVRRMELLFDEIERYLNTHGFGPRPARGLTPAERARRSAEHLYANHFDCSMGPSEHYLGQALAFARAAEPGPRRLNDMAVITYSAALQTGGQNQQDPGVEAAQRLFAELLQQHPTYVMGWFNFGYMAWKEEKLDEAAACFSRAYDLLIGGTGEFDPWALYNHEQHLEPQGFKKAYNDALFAMARDGSDQEVRGLVAANCAYFMSRYRQQRGEVFEAYDLLCAACELDRGRGEFARKAAHAADILGYWVEARVHYQNAVDLLPLDLECRMALIGFLTRVGELDSGKAMLYQAVDLLRAVQGKEHLRHDLQFLATAVGHVHQQTPVMSDLLTDRYAVAAIGELCGNPAADPRIDARVLELLQMQGKTEAAARWSEAAERRRSMHPNANVLLADYAARRQGQVAPVAAPGSGAATQLTTSTG